MSLVLFRDSAIATFESMLVGDGIAGEVNPNRTEAPVSCPAMGTELLLSLDMTFVTGEE